MAGPNESYPAEYDLPDYEGIETGQRLLREMHKVCCQDESKEPQGEWSMHSDDWTHSYPPDAGVKVPSVCVEVRVKLDVHGATTRWIYDSDYHVDSHEYGEEVLFPDEPDEEEHRAKWAEWLAQLQAQIGKAAEAAWDADVLSCGWCGYHYHAGHEPCCTERT